MGQAKSFLLLGSTRHKCRYVYSTREALEKLSLNKTTRKIVPVYWYLFLAFYLGKWWLNQMCDLVTDWLRCKSSHKHFSGPQGLHRCATCCEVPRWTSQGALQGESWEDMMHRDHPTPRETCRRRGWELRGGKGAEGSWTGSRQRWPTAHPPSLLQAFSSPDF